MHKGALIKKKALMHDLRIKMKCIDYEIYKLIIIVHF